MLTKLATILLVASSVIFAQSNRPIIILNGGSISGGGVGTGAEITNINVTATSPTVALLTVDYPSSAPFGIEISKYSDFSVPFNDVDPTKFPGYNLSSRPGSIVNGVHLTIPLGRRGAAQRGADGVYYSCAHSALTTYYGRLTSPGRSSVTFSYTTLNIPFGSTHLDSEPINRSRPGELAQPHISLNDKTEEIVDPGTGLLIKRMNSSKDIIAGRINGTPISVIRNSNGAAWSNIPNGLFQDSNYVASSGTGNLFLSIKTGTGDSSPYLNSMNSFSNPYSGVKYSFGYFQALLRLSMNNGGSLSSNPEENKFVAGLTVDGVNYWDPTHVYENTLTTSQSTITLGTSNEGDLWQGAQTKPTPSYVEQATRNGTVTCAGTTTVNYVGGDLFALHWVAGSIININGVDYTIANLINSYSLTTVNICPAGTFVYSATNFGILIHKKTGPGTISLDSGVINYSVNVSNNFTVRNTFLCSETTVNDSNGNAGYVCRHAAVGLGVYWVNATTGESHLFRNTNGAGCSSDLPQMFNPTDPDTMTCAADGTVRYEKYYGDHADLPYGLGQYTGLPSCNTGGSNTPPYTSQQPCTVQTVQTIGTNIGNLIEAFSQNVAYPPVFDKARFNKVSFKDQDSNGAMLFHARSEGQYALGWAAIYDPNAHTNGEGGDWGGALNNHGCVGGGNPGCIMAAMPTWERPGIRWCPLKDGSSIAAGWVEGQNGSWFPTFAGSNGPYYVDVVSGTVNGVGNTFGDTGTMETCPTNPLGRTGPRCTSVTVNGEPRSDGVRPGESGVPGELSIIKVGDRFVSSVINSQTFINGTGGPFEQMEVVKKVAGSVSGTWVLTFYRAVNMPLAIYNNGGVLRTGDGANPRLYTICNCIPDPPKTYPGSSWEWNWKDDAHGMNSTGLTLSGQGDPINPQGHYFWSNGNYVGIVNPSEDSRCSGNCYLTRLAGGAHTMTQEVFSPPDAAIGSSPRFAGHNTGLNQTNYQSHPSSGGIRADTTRFPYFFDGREYYGGGSSGDSGNFATNVSGQLWKFTVSQLSNLDYPFRKFYETSANVGHIPLVDISGPNSSISDTSGDSYKYCHAEYVNECRNGSAIGDLYVNAPHISYPYCVASAQNENLSDPLDICVGGMGTVKDAVTQTKIDVTESAGKVVRVLTRPGRPRTFSPFWTPTVLPNGQWMIFETSLSGDGSVSKALMLGKVPPPGTDDGVDRTNFIPVNVTVPAKANSYAMVKFGYLENGLASDYYCTSRLESCFTKTLSSGTFDTTDPFYYASQTPTLPDCSAGCTIKVPAITQRIVYTQVVYKDKTSGVISTLSPTVAAVP